MNEEITTRLERTLQKLQARVRDQENILEKLRSSSAPLDPEPSSDAKAYFQQLRALKLAYETVTPSLPYIPSHESPIPALLALRVADTCIKHTEACITSEQSDLQRLQRRLEKEQSDLNDAKLIQTGLKTRIASLKVDIEKRTQKNPAQIVKDMMREVKTKRDSYDRQTGELVQAFNDFINKELAAMLAAEELGGPIVGAIQDVDDEMLEAGFNNQGKAKKTRKKFNEDKHQQRIDKIWGPRPDGEDVEEHWNEKSAAAAEMRELTEQLLNSLVEARGNGPGAYVGLERESAASRFLVRSKVAQFHPKDATKLRLIDFGGEFND
ncbi:hypothetical protein BJ878DRAFT_584589 [Calycina marina]|uniref:Uncharacterized protein n=1 Tax=Calycina marina TaxID=1763456 RepID=A0A9P7YWR1_9HELO|nr:hypothetical protein BJ878DRAFT_584589 [Calycina marina]